MTSKSKLNLYCQKTHIPVPCYLTERVSEGFVSTVTVAERTHKSQIAHPTKKAAENDAASVAVQLIVQNHPEVTNIDQLIDSQTPTKKRSTWQRQHLSPNVTQVYPPSPPLSQHVTQLVGPNGQQLSPGMIDRSNHSQLYSQGQSPISCVQSPAPASLLSSPSQPVLPPTHVQHHWDNVTVLKGKPSTAIPASPNHVHGVPSSITPSSPTGQTALGSLQNTPSPAFSAPSPLVNPSTTSPSRTISKYQQALESFCQLRGLSPPKYHIVQNMKDRYTARVTVGSNELSTEREYEDFDTAKESATALAVIELGLEALALSNSGGPNQTPLQQQAHPFRQPHQQTFQASTFTNTTPHHPQQVSLAPTSVHTAGSLPLHPPSFFQTSLSSQTLSVDSPQSQFPKTGHFPQQTPPHPSLHNPQPVLLLQPATATLPTTPACTTLTGLATMSATPAHARVLSPVSLQTTPVCTTLTSLATLATTPSHASPVSLRTTPAHVLQSRGGGAQQQSNMALPPGEYKQILNLYCQKKHINLPSYSYEFPEDSVGYIASVTVEGKTFTSPPQGSKKVAESIAAAEAVKEMGIKPEQSSAAGSDGEWHQVPLASHTGTSISFKNLLQEYSQKLKLSSLPRYTTEWTDGGFKSTVSVQRSSGETAIFTGGVHSVKKAAEQDVARIACTELKLLAPQ